MSIVLELKDIVKEFPGVKALDKVSFILNKGEVLSLVGENGAGKSTLMNIISGTLQPDNGEIIINGKTCKIEGPTHARSLGVSIIHQELTIVPNMTVAENIFALQEPTKLGLVNDKKMVKETKELLNTLKMDINPNQLAGNLPVSQQQLIEIAKALSFDTDIIIMDEPTSALSLEETDNLLDLIKELRNEGKSIIYISHKLSEVAKISDSIAVLRDGELVSQELAYEMNEEKLVSLMVGRKMSNVYPPKDFEYLEDKYQIEIDNYNCEKKFNNISFGIRPGEILGLYGLMGSGRTEIAQGIFGILKKDNGILRINDEVVTVNSPYDAIRHKIAFVTEDRKSEGLILSADIKENITGGNINKILSKMGLIDSEKEKSIALKHIKQLAIKTPTENQLLHNLSGGNQQKVVLGKWFEIKPKILILDEPTRGIDVGAKYEIYELIIELARQGLSILLISSDLPEVLNMSDRLLVVNDGKVIDEVNPKEATQEEIMWTITKEA